MAKHLERMSENEQYQYKEKQNVSRRDTHLPRGRKYTSELTDIANSYT
jgi:hypothetical protein